jgi:sugar phosphate isomerase/epimerase
MKRGISQENTRRSKTSHATSAGTGRRKRLVTHCHHCQAKGQERIADFVHLCWAPATDLGPIGLCWPCYHEAAKQLLEMYQQIMTIAAEIKVLFALLPEEEQRIVHPTMPPTYDG